MRRALVESGAVAAIVPTADPHLNEYIRAEWAVREALSGFTGSAGTLLVSIDAAALYTARFALALVTGSLVMLTTTPTQLSDAFDRMLSPLSRLGLPGHEIAMVFSLMMRFVPTLADEASAIIDAQSLRGGAFDEGGPVRRVRSIVPVVVALLASGLRHADGLSRALDARCYEGGTARTHYHEQRLTHRDLIAAALTATFILALTLLG